MQRTPLVSGALAALLTLTAACGESATGAPGDGGLRTDEILELAAEFGAQDAATLGGFGTPSYTLSPGTLEPGRAVTVVTNFRRTRNCPGGGNVELLGTLTYTRESETKSASDDFSATRTENACVFRTPLGDAITVSGNPRSILSALHEVTGGVAQVGMARKQGSFVWSKENGASGTCTMDLGLTWDPASKVFTVNGMFCGQGIHLTREWTI